MASLLSRDPKKQTRSDSRDEFEKYLMEQCSKTTFNGIELDAFSRYRKFLENR